MTTLLQVKIAQIKASFALLPQSGQDAMLALAEKAGFASMEAMTDAYVNTVADAKYMLDFIDKTLENT